MADDVLSRANVGTDRRLVAQLETVRIEKAAQDAGFDRTPEWRGGWLVFRASALADALAAQSPAADVFRVGMENLACAEKVAADCGVTLLRSTGDWPAILAPVAGYAALPAFTEAERLVVQRVGQDIFRQSLIGYWQGRCAVSGLDVVPLLRASHIKPWADCANDGERLDVFNGLLLAPHLDALFDGGWIGFAGDGELLVSHCLPGPARVLLGLRGERRRVALTDGHRRYLAWHREKVFRAQFSARGG